MSWGSITKGERITVRRNVQCPFWRMWDGHRIICESVVLPERQNTTTVLQLRTALEAKSYIESHCYRIDSGRVCPVARMLNLYYAGEKICGTDPDRLKADP